MYRYIFVAVIKHQRQGNFIKKTGSLAQSLQSQGDGAYISSALVVVDSKSVCGRKKSHYLLVGNERYSPRACSQLTQGPPTKLPLFKVPPPPDMATLGTKLLPHEPLKGHT
jgi:hypothetical protein